MNSKNKKRNSKGIVVGIGEALWDILPNGKFAGGAPANFTYHVSQFGYKGIVVSAIGNDKLGNEIVEDFETKGLDFNLEKVPYPTGVVQVNVDAEGVPSYDIKENVAWDNIPFTTKLEKLAKQVKAVCFGSLAQRNIVSRETINKFLDAIPEEKGRYKIFDINLRQGFYNKDILETAFNKCNILKINDEELVAVSRLFNFPGIDLQDKCWLLLAKYNLKMLILTCGINGSYVFTPGYVSFVETPKVAVNDTVGAGDSFTAAFISAILNGKSVTEAHMLAVDVSAFVCTRNGAMPELPDSFTRKPQLSTTKKNKPQIIPFHYDREKVKAGIVHIGVGNFHRAHEAFLTDKLLTDATQSEWGICGIMLLPGDEHLYRSLKKQDNIYTLTVCGRNDKDEVHRIGSLVELIWGIENPQAVFEKIASSTTKIISLTITEGGYNMDKHSGKFILDNQNVVYDLINPHTPKTVFGFIAEGLRKRRESGNGAITILSCDNLQHNGDTAKRMFSAFIAAQDAALAEWVSQNVTFPNSMVDRITPATTPSDIERLNFKNGTDDQAPVYCEDFIQWVIEDRFIAGRPAWEQVGVEFTDNVKAYENMKLSLLNASHTMLSYPAFLSGYRKVDDAMRDLRFVSYLRTFMDKDITPYVPVPGNTDLELYKQTLLERFGNRSVSDQLSRLCADGVSKIPVYVMPNLQKMVRDDADLSHVAFLFAAYRHYLKYKVDDKGESYEIYEPWLTVEDLDLISSDNTVDFLDLSPFASTALRVNDQFVDLFLLFAYSIREKGVLSLMESISNYEFTKTKTLKISESR